MAKKIYQGYDFNGNPISGVAAGVADTDAANKGQVDAALLAAQTYTDSKVEGLGEFVSQISPAGGLPTTGSGNAGTIDKGDWWYINAPGTLLGVEVHQGDRLQAAVSNPDTADNTAANTDFFLLHTLHLADTRYEIPETALAAGVPTTITHNLAHRFVNVVVTDTLGAPVDVAVVYTDENSLTITASTAVTVTGVVSA